MSTPVPRSDGDSIRVWVKAHDVMGNTAVDSVLVHVDSSPPVIQDIWMNRNGMAGMPDDTSFATDLEDVR